MPSQGTQLCADQWVSLPQFLPLQQQIPAQQQQQQWPSVQQRVPQLQQWSQVQQQPLQPQQQWQSPEMQQQAQLLPHEQYPPPHVHSHANAAQALSDAAALAVSQSSAPATHSGTLPVPDAEAQSPMRAIARDEFYVPPPCAPHDTPIYASPTLMPGGADFAAAPTSALPYTVASAAASSQLVNTDTSRPSAELSTPRNSNYLSEFEDSMQAAPVLDFAALDRQAKSALSTIVRVCVFVCVCTAASLVKTTKCTHALRLQPQLFAEQMRHRQSSTQSIIIVALATDAHCGFRMCVV